MTRALGEVAAIETDLRQAMAARKCWRCGCFQDTVSALRESSTIMASLASELDEAHELFETKRYDCLGCEVCWPATAQNLAAVLDPAVAEGSHCATEEPEHRDGWPPLPGDYRVVRFQAAVAVCTLNAGQLVHELADIDCEGLSVVGSLHTENLGIEHLIRNVLGNPHIRFLIVCGEDTRKAIGHLPGQSLISLVHHGVDDDMRIAGAKGKRPFLKNLSKAHIDAFRRQVRLIACVGETDIATLAGLIRETAANDPGPFEGIPDGIIPLVIETVGKPERLVLDPAGYFVVFPDRAQNRLVLEHYSNKGVLSRMFAATSPAAISSAVIEAELISRLDHAAYLGRELARAEHALMSGEEYVQDRAPGIAAKAACSKPGCDRRGATS